MEFFDPYSTVKFMGPLIDKPTVTGQGPQRLAVFKVGQSQMGEMVIRQVIAMGELATIMKDVPRGEYIRIHGDLTMLPAFGNPPTMTPAIATKKIFREAELLPEFKALWDQDVAARAAQRKEPEQGPSY